MFSERALDRAYNRIRYIRHGVSEPILLRHLRSWLPVRPRYFVPKWRKEYILNHLVIWSHKLWSTPALSHARPLNQPASNASPFNQTSNTLHDNSTHPQSYYQTDILANRLKPPQLSLCLHRYPYLPSRRLSPLRSQRPRRKHLSQMQFRRYVPLHHREKKCYTCWYIASGIPPFRRPDVP